MAWLLEKVGLPPDACAALSARILRRPAPAHRDRARARAQSQGRGRRRIGVGARRVDPGADRQPDARPAARTRHRLPVHLARHGRGRAHQPSRRRDVPRPDRRDRPAPRDVRESAASVHAQADGARCRSPIRRAATRSASSLSDEIPSPIRAVGDEPRRRAAGRRSARIISSPSIAWAAPTEDRRAAVLAVSSIQPDVSNVVGDNQ